MDILGRLSDQGYPTEKLSVIKDFVIIDCLAEKGYHLGQLLGEGAQSVVYSVLDSDNNEYAAKFIINIEDYHIEYEFCNEAWILKWLTDSNDQIVPKFYDSWQCNGYMIEYGQPRDSGKIDSMKVGVIIMEKMDGNLESILKERSISVQTLVDWIKQIEQLSLKLTGKYRVIHYDLFPRNIFYRIIDDQMSFYIADFGIAWLYDENLQPIHNPHCVEQEPYEQFELDQHRYHLYHDILYLEHVINSQTDYRIVIDVPEVEREHYHCVI